MTTIKTIKVSDKGQIAIPMDIRELMGIEKGDELLIAEHEGKILIEKATAIGAKMIDDFKDVMSFAETSLKEVWDNKEDDIWETYL